MDQSLIYPLDQPSGSHGDGPEATRTMTASGPIRFHSHRHLLRVSRRRPAHQPARRRTVCRSRQPWPAWLAGASPSTCAPSHKLPSRAQQLAAQQAPPSVSGFGGLMSEDQMSAFTGCAGVVA